MWHYNAEYWNYIDHLLHLRELILALHIMNKLPGINIWSLRSFLFSSNSFFLFFNMFEYSINQWEPIFETGQLTWWSTDVGYPILFKGTLKPWSRLVEIIIVRPHHDFSTLTIIKTKTNWMLLKTCDVLHLRQNLYYLKDNQQEMISSISTLWNISCHVLQDTTIVVGASRPKNLTFVFSESKLNFSKERTKKKILDLGEAMRKKLNMRFPSQFFFTHTYYAINKWVVENMLFSWKRNSY